MRTDGNEGDSNPGKSTPSPGKEREWGSGRTFCLGKSEGDSKFKVASGAAPHLDLPLLLPGLVSGTRKHMEDFSWSRKYPNYSS